MENHENLIGRVLGDRYKIEAIVGEGGMSVVMRASDTLKKRDVTIKLLTLKDGEPNAAERFTNEAKAVAMLSHPNIVSVYDVSLTGSEKYIVMEYINGITLKEYLDKKGRLEWREAVHYTNQILGALSHAHSKGVIHRDVKPENVMLMRDGSIKVIDFGIAKLPDSKSLTVIDKAIGTVNYISPEQASGKNSDEKSDIYSTGILLYELVTGQLPFVSSSSVAVAMMHVSSEPAMPSSLCESIPKGLEQIIIKAMMKDPERRFGTASAMKKAIEYLIAYPETVFKENPVTGPDGKPVTGTGAALNTGNNTVINTLVNPGNGNATVPGNDNVNSADSNDSDDDDDDEYSYVKPAKPSMFPIVLGVTLAFFTVVILFLVLAWNSFGDMIFSDKHRDSDSNTVKVPDLVNAEYTDELEKELMDMGFNVTVTEVSNVSVESGYIVEQEPLANSTKKKVKDGVKLELKVSKGTAEMKLSDYKHYEKESVRLELEKSGIRVVMEYEFNEDIIKNHVIRTTPEKGTAVLEGDTVTVYVSRGPEDLTVKIPDVSGMTYDEAEYELQKLSLNVEKCEDDEMEFSNTYEQGTVIRTIPKKNSSVSLSTGKVKVILSKGKEPEPEPEPENEPEFVIPGINGNTPEAPSDGTATVTPDTGDTAPADTPVVPPETDKQVVSDISDFIM